MAYVKEVIVLSDEEEYEKNVELAGRFGGHAYDALNHGKNEEAMEWAVRAAHRARLAIMYRAVM